MTVFPLDTYNFNPVLLMEVQSRDKNKGMKVRKNVFHTGFINLSLTKKIFSFLFRIPKFGRSIKLFVIRRTGLKSICWR